MSIAIETQIAPEYAVDGMCLSQAAAMTLRQLGRAGCGLTVVITDDKSVRSLNCRFRQIDSVTDVLSFPASSTPQLSAGEEEYVGDIVIAYPYVLEEARKSDISVRDLLSMLVVHGTLHLLGYDHDRPATWKTMWALQSAALKALGIDPDLVNRYGGLVLE